MSSLGNKQIMSSNITYYMNKFGKTRSEVCEALGVKYTTFTDWIKGNTYPRIDKIELMANYFGISKSDLVEEQNNNETSQKSNTINVLGHVAAGIPIEEIEDVIDTEEISESLARTGEFFGLKIKGDSMEPRICNGDYVIVRQQNDAESGDIVIVEVNNKEDREVTCKRLVKYSSSIALVSLNSKYEPMMFTNEEIESKPVKIIGKVVELRGKL